MKQYKNSLNDIKNPIFGTFFSHSFRIFLTQKSINIDKNRKVQLL
ncbi:hypothetical protein HDC91_002173 [Mucilaginibacter sp. AK015]|nr:hypothetical protein [Mucilaginibacter sp. AK015]